MRIKRLWIFVPALLGVLVNQYVIADTIVQLPGTDFLVVEAEAFDSDDLNDEFNGWLVIGPENPQEVELHSSNPGTIMVPPPISNPSGGLAIFDQVGGGDFADQLLYSLQFAETGDYFLYFRMSTFDLRNLAADDYGNEDSIYLPVDTIDEDPTNADLRASRDGFIDLNQVGLPSEGCRDPFDEPYVIPDEECDAEGLRADVHMEGQYFWQNANWNNGLGHANYEIEQAGVALDFAVASRERGSSIDVFVFSQKPDLQPEDLDELIASDPVDPCDFDGDGSLGLGDLNQLLGAVASGNNDSAFDITGDGLVNVEDVNLFVGDESKLHTWIGDANLDGEFNSGDFVQVFQAGLFETENPADWSQGDWNGDGVFSSGDFVAAFQDGGFEIGPKWQDAGVAAVPEPNCVLLILVTVFACGFNRSRWRM